MKPLANSPVVLDRVDGLSLSAPDAGRYGNELRSLKYLAQGLIFLNRQVASFEDQLRQRTGPVCVLVGNHPLLEGIPQGLIACAFHWYAVSACNYSRLVGWVANGEDTTRALGYVKSVLPQVYVWRNKVGAHFARTEPHKEDTPAVFAASVMFPIGLVNGRFSTQPFDLIVTRSGKASSSGTEMRWSLTETHSALTTRYWPEALTPKVGLQSDNDRPVAKCGERKR
jgi:hypothetical protein